MTGSNRRPPACKAGALPAELIPRWVDRIGSLVGLVGLEPTTPALSRRCSNQLSYRPQPSNLFWSSMGHPTTDKCGYLASNSFLHFPERRSSSRTFRYGYLVTTSPQSRTPPW